MPMARWDSSPDFIDALAMSGMRTAVRASS
jgi:hypothetical protein